KGELLGKRWFVSRFRSECPRTRERDAARAASNRSARVATSQALPTGNAGVISRPSGGTLGSEIHCPEPGFATCRGPHDRARDEGADGRTLSACGVGQVY